MRSLATCLRAFLADMFLGLPCPYGCGHRARCHRSHIDLDHAGDDLQ